MDDCFCVVKWWAFRFPNLPAWVRKPEIIVPGQVGSDILKDPEVLRMADLRQVKKNRYKRCAGVCSRANLQTIEREWVAS